MQFTETVLLVTFLYATLHNIPQQHIIILIHNRFHYFMQNLKLSYDYHTFIMLMYKYWCLNV